MYSEHDLIERLRLRFGAGSAVRGIGDDAAVLDPPPGCSLLFCSDLLIENTHFRTTTHPPESIGFKAVAVNVSDIGAMGGMPGSCVLSLVVSPETTGAWTDRLFDGVARACAEFSVELVGGDTSAGERIFVDVAMLGHVEAGGSVGRDGARPGDGIYVTGALGGSARGLELLMGGDPNDPLIRRHLYPAPRHLAGRAVRKRASSMIDLSDGLSSDLAHILEASEVSARIEADRIPRAPGASLAQALDGGEDYELVITGRDLPSELDGVSVTRIGDIIPSEGRHETRIVSESGERRLDVGGWEHFG